MGVMDRIELFTGWIDQTTATRYNDLQLCAWAPINSPQFNRSVSCRTISSILPAREKSGVRSSLLLLLLAPAYYTLSLKFDKSLIIP